MATRAVLTPYSAEFGSTNFPQLLTIHSTARRPALAFDAATSEKCYWTVVAPQGLTGAQTLVITCVMASATSGTLALRVGVEAITPLDAVTVATAESFDTLNSSSNTTVPGTLIEFALSITLTNADSMAAADSVRFSLDRDVATDSGAGDAYVLSAEWRDSA